MNEEPTCPDCGERRTYCTCEQVGDVASDARGSGARFNSGKPAFELMPLFVLEPALEVLDYGRKKYAEWNWAKGQKYSVIMASMLRHLSAFQEGEDYDPESGLSHVGHILCNALFLSFMWIRCRDMDDRPEKITKAYHRNMTEVNPDFRLRDFNADPTP